MRFPLVKRCLDDVGQWVFAPGVVVCHAVGDVERWCGCVAIDGGLLVLGFEISIELVARKKEHFVQKMDENNGAEEEAGDDIEQETLALHRGWGGQKQLCIAARGERQ